MMSDRVYNSTGYAPLCYDRICRFYTRITGYTFLALGATHHTSTVCTYIMFALLLHLMKQESVTVLASCLSFVSSNMQLIPIANRHTPM